MCALVYLYVLLAASFVYGSPLTLNRIKGGNVVSIQQFGFIASLGTVRPGSQHYHACGATILTPDCVLTAAQCVGLSQTQPLYRVRVGSTFFAFGGQLVDVSTYFIHPGFSRNTFDNDIALLQLSNHVPAGTPFVYIPLQGSIVPVGMVATVLGWGYLHPNIPVLSDNLRAVNVSTVDWNTCRNRYALLSGLPAVTSNMICAGILDIGGSDFCNGDEGGPLIVTGDLQIGIASWSYECGHSFWPGVYTDLTDYTTWIVTMVMYYFN